jgi:small-conductance mechanosensitive channel
MFRMNFQMHLRAALAMTICLMTAGISLAQQVATPHGQLQLWDQALTRLEAALGESETILPGDSIDYRASLGAILANARQLRESEAGRLPQLRLQLDSLGPAPGADQPPEDKEVAKKRRQIANEISLAEGRIKQSDLAIARANALTMEIGRKEQAEIQGQLLAGGPSPVMPATWVHAFNEDLGVLSQTRSAIEAWSERTAKSAALTKPLLVSLLLLVLVVVLAIGLRRMILRKWGPSAKYGAPSYARRLAAAFAGVVAGTLPPILAVWAIVLFALQLMPGDEVVRLRSLCLTIGMQTTWFLLAIGLAFALLSPRLPAWRILPVPEWACGRVAGRIVAGSGFVLALSIARSSLVNSATGIPGLHAGALLALFYAVGAGAIFLPILRARYWSIDSGTLGSQFSRLARIGAALTILAAIAAATLGYANLSRHLLIALSATAVALGGLFLVRALFAELLRALFAPDGRYYPKVAATTGISPESGRRTIFWLRLLFEFMIWPPALYLLLIIYGMSPALLDTWTSSIVQGVAIGNLSISPIDVGAALATVIVGFLAVGSLKRWMRDRVMPNTGLDRGLQNSVATGVGYLGGVVVLMLGVVALGIDLGNLALVAGALSVGMGFGLKTVVENFVAGILLLIERPIKAGDWIVVGATEGIVKSISVRSTEIETFDRSSVILPNSELIASPVTNWTHKNRIARIIVKVAIATDNDPKKAERIMVESASAHPRVMRHPAPSVVFRAMGATVQMELRCFVADTDYYLPVLSDLNFRIFEAFRSEGVKLPA